MALKETYIRNLRKAQEQHPDAIFINVARQQLSRPGLEMIPNRILSPTKSLLNDWLGKKISWDEYTERFLRQMEAPQCIDEMRRIGELAKSKDVYLVCYCTTTNCHRFLLMELIQKMHPDLKVIRETEEELKDVPAAEIEKLFRKK